MTNLPVAIRITENALPKVKAEFASLSAQEKRAINDRLKLLSQQRRIENELTREVKERIREQQKLNALTRKLDTSLAGQKGGIGGLGALGLGGIGGALAGGFIAREVFQFAKDAEALGREAQGAETRLTKLLGSTQKYEQAVRQARDITEGLVSETELATGMFLLLDNGLAKNTEQASKLARASSILVPIFEAQGASQEKFLRLLSGGNVALFDNFNLTLQQVNAKKAEIEATQGLIGQEAKQAAIKELLIEKSEQLAEAVTEEQKAAQRFDRSVQDLTVTLGQSLVPVFTSIREEGARAFDALNDHIKNVNAISPSIDAATFGVLFTEEQRLGEAVKETTETTKEAVKITHDYESAIEAATEAVEKQRKEQEKHKELLEKTQRNAVRDMLDLEKQAAIDTQETWDEYFENEQKAWADYGKNVVEINKDAAKDLQRIDKELARDLKKNERDLQKDLAKITKDENKQIEKLKKDAAKEEKQQRRLRQIDARGDERLFQFELRQLAAEGEANAIQQALERRKIEQEIEAEKQREEGQIKAQNLDDEIAQIREAAQAEREEARATAQERASELQAEAEAARALRQEQLAEELAQEQESYAQRQEELRKYRDEKIAQIEQGKLDAIAKLAEELTQIEGLSKQELEALKPVAGKIGDAVGVAFAEGLSGGFLREQEISRLLSQAVSNVPTNRRSSGGGELPTTGGHGAPRPFNHSGSNVTMGFAEGGSFTVGGSGGTDSQLVQFRATPGEQVSISPKGQSQAITMVFNGVGMDMFMKIMERKVQEGIDEYDDLLSSMLN